MKHSKEKEIDIIRRIAELIDARASETEERIAGSVSKAFQRVESEMYVMREELREEMSEVKDGLKRLGEFTSSFYENHERRLKALEAR